MNTNTCLLPHYIHDNKIVSTCDFIPNQIVEGIVIYEVIRVIDSIPIFFNEHIQRFFDSLSGMGATIKLQKTDVAKRIFALIDVNKLSIGNIRFQITLGQNNSELFMAWVSPFHYPTELQYREGIKLASLEKQRETPNIKKYNSDFKNSISEIIKNKDVYEVLLIDENNTITEGSRSNIFFVDSNTIVTPKSSHVLPGITRQKIMEIACKNNVEIKESEIKLESINNYTAAFITGTSPKILPIASIDLTAFRPDNLTISLLLKSYNQLIENYIVQHNRSSFVTNLH